MKMKKRFLLSLFLALVLVLSFSSVAMATDPTTVDVTWDGAGIIGGTVVAGDDATVVWTSQGVTSNTGEFHAADQNNNPYGYNVDTCSFSLEASLAGGGLAMLDVLRTDAKTSYGAAGQRSYTFVGIDDGTATLQNRSGTNYASMRDCNYSWNSNDHITVTGASYYALSRFMDSENSVTGDANFAGLQAWGSGDADLDCMNAEASAGQVRLGKGCGCYTNADFTANGIGTLQLDGVGNNSATTAMAPGMTGATSFQFIASWVGTFSIADYSITAN